MAIKSCAVCREESNQCLSCASYVVDGERIYYEKLKDFGAVKEHELRFIDRIRKQRVMAFFHNGKLYIPSRQGRSVPLAIGLQWDAWKEQQSKIEQLEKEKQDLHNAFVYMDECRKEWHEGYMHLHEQKTEITRLVQSLQNEFDLNSDCPQVERQIELLEEALRGES